MVEVNATEYIITLQLCYKDRLFLLDFKTLSHPMAVFNAVEGDALFSLSDRGYVTLTETAQTIFHHDATGCCRYQYPRTLEWNTQMLEKIREMNKIH